ncbi:MAG: VIT domain-containing protein [Planctomycetota bacterium]
MRRTVPFVLAAMALGLVAPRPGVAGTLKDDGRAGLVTAMQGVALVRPVGRERWTPLDERALLFPGDVVRTEARGANALEVRTKDGARLVVGPGAMLELPNEGGLRVMRGELEVKAGAAAAKVTGTGGFTKDVAATAWLRATDTTTTELAAEPKWLTGYRSSTSEEWMGSLLANVDGKNVALSVGYHKVTVEIRDQIARTTVEESFVNATDGTLEGTFSFPLPADASISGFGMWIGDELVEADLVEKERARAIYEDILRRKRDPGLLEWEGGNLFKARVFPIFPHSEKRIRIRYTQVLPLEGETYRYRYALRSELLRANPLRELSMAVNVTSAATIADVSSATHPVVVRKTEHEAVAEFGAQQYVPERDFELAVTVGRGPGVAALSHRRGEDGFFMLLVAPPDPAASGWQRDLVPDGAPLDLVFVADTSGSMDPAARAAQSAFLAAMLAQLSEKDRFRLMACDVEPVWVVEAPTPASPAAAEKALAALDARYSLGWTDLDRAFAALIGKVAAGTQVVYVGDGVPTSGDADAVATADRLKRAAAGTGATFHAVTTSASYETVVLDALASVGGGSVRRAEGAPAGAAKALLGEVARPGLRGAKVEIQGVPTARVYPETLPNAPLGTQQVVLGRFLPGATASTATVVVTGTVAGQPVRFTSPLAVPAADEGNSFLPRLWARRHLDVLLAQGRSPAVKDEVVAFSREYQIMTPYTSFLVLENDEDRATYGVERTVKMRDAERFFADARDKAALEIARQQTAAAKGWRLGLRREILRDIAGLRRDREVPTPVAEGRVELEADGLFTREYGLGTGGSAGRRLHFASREAGAKSGEDWSGTVDGLAARSEAKLADFAGPMPAPTAAAPMMAPGAPPGDDPGMAESDGAEAGDDGESPEATDADAPAEERLDKAKDVSRRVMDRRAGAWNRRGLGQASTAAWTGAYDFKPAGARGDAGRSAPRYDAAALGFPGLGAPPKPPEDETDPKDWPAEAVAAVRALDRRPALAALDGALRVTRTTESLQPLRGTVAGRDRATAIGTARTFLTRYDGSQGMPFTTWLSETERAVLADARRLGRKRAAADADRGWAWLPVGDFSLGGVLRSLARHGKPPTVTREGDLLTLTFATDAETPHLTRYVIDTKRKVLVELAEGTADRGSSSRRFADFVEVAGAWWATRVEQLDAEGQRTSRETLVVEKLDAAAYRTAFDAAVAATADGVFLATAEPTALAAKQAVHDGKATLADRLVIVLEHGAYGRFDDLWKAWADVEPFLTGKPGADWMRLALLGRSRRGAELLPAVEAMAKAVAAGTDPADVARAQLLMADARSLGATAHLGVVRTLLPVFARPGPYADLLPKAAARQLADALGEAGDGLAELAARKALHDAEPDALDAVLGYANALRQREDLLGALETVTARLANGGPWTLGEADQLRSHRVGWLQELRDLPELARTAEAWVAANPRATVAYQIRLTTQYLTGKDADADRFVVAQLAAPFPAKPDEAVDAAREAAVSFALGQGWNFWAQAVPVATRAALAELALRSAHADGVERRWAQQLLHDWRFRQTEEARGVLATLRKELTAPGAAAALPRARLADWVHLTVEGLDEAAKTALVDALKARWRAAPDDVERDAIAGLVLTLLPSDGRAEPRIVFLRERFERADAGHRLAAAAELLDALTSAPWEAAREDEAFALAAARLDPAPKDAAATAQRAAVAATSARTLSAWVHEGRRLAALGTPEAQRARTRAAALEAGKAALAKARAETAARLATAVAASQPPLRTWYEVERLGYAAETLADLARVEGEAREVLEAVPAGSVEPLDAHLADRAAGVLAYVATRRTAPAGLADRVLALFRARIVAEDRLLDDRREVFALLVALDRVDELEAALNAWIRPDVVNTDLRVALARVQAEKGDLKAAAATLEAAATVGDLDASAWGSLAGWYLVLKEDARRDAALDRVLGAEQAWQLQQRLWQEAARVSRSGGGVPAELDPEMLRVLRFLLTKAEDPGNYVGNALQLYRPTKDFRVLEALADGVTGHAPEAVYRYLQQVTSIVGDIHEEATCDALGERLAAALAKATRDVDRRALRLVLSAVHARAAAVPKADPAQGRKALSALTAAFEGGLVPGERLLFARHLATLQPSVPGVAEEQMRQLLALRAGSDGDRNERLALDRTIADVLWARGRHDEAADRLSAALDAIRAEVGGTLPPDAFDDYGTLLGWWQSMGRFRVAEDRLRGDLAKETRSMRREQLRLRLFQLYGAALANGATLSLGGGVALFRAGSAELEQYLLEGPAYLLGEAAQAHAALSEAATRSAPSADPGAAYLAFARARLATLTERVPQDAMDLLQLVLAHLERVAGPRAALELALDAYDRDLPWRHRNHQGVWDRFSGNLAEWRRVAADARDLERRLLPIVLKHLEEELSAGQQGANAFCHVRNTTFWTAHRRDFLAVAKKVAEVNAGRPEVALSVARYLADGLEDRAEAIATLEMVLAQGRDPEPVRHTLTTWLRDAGRFADAWPHAQRLVAERPTNAAYRFLAADVLHGLRRAADVRALLEAGVAPAKAEKLWVDDLAAAYGKKALEVGHPDLAVLWTEEALQLRRDAGGSVSGVQPELAAWYGTLARARSARGETDAAVKAATAAVVAWGNDQRQRGEALDALRAVLAAANDLEAWQGRYDAEVAAAGTDAPVLRKALAAVWTDRGRNDLAVAQLRLARDLDPLDGETHGLLVQALDRLGDAKGALDALFASVRLAPRNLQAYADLAARFDRVGDAVAGERARTNLVEAAPSEPEGHRMLAAIRASAGRLDLAAERWRQVVRVRPDDPTGWLSLADTLTRLGDAAGARKTLEHVLSRTWEERFGDVKQQAAQRLAQLR